MEAILLMTFLVSPFNWTVNTQCFRALYSLTNQYSIYNPWHVIYNAWSLIIPCAKHFNQIHSELWKSDLWKLFECYRIYWTPKSKEHSSKSFQMDNGLYFTSSTGHWPCIGQQIVFISLSPWFCIPLKLFRMHQNVFHRYTNFVV